MVRKEQKRVDYSRPDWAEQSRKLEQERRRARSAATQKYRKKRKLKLLTVDQEPIRFEAATGDLDVLREPGPCRQPVGPFRTYKMTIAQILALHAKQGGRCPICRTIINPLGRSRAVDHDWKTGNVRGMLCKACNIGLGCFRDDPRRLLAAVLYLGYSREQILEILEMLKDPLLMIVETRRITKK